MFLCTIPKSKIGSKSGSGNDFDDDDRTKITTLTTTTTKLKQSIEHSTLFEQKILASLFLERKADYRATADLLAEFTKRSASERGGGRGGREGGKLLQASSTELKQQEEEKQQHLLEKSVIPPLHRANTKEFISRLLSSTRSVNGDDDSNTDTSFFFKGSEEVKEEEMAPPPKKRKRGRADAAEEMTTIQTTSNKKEDKFAGELKQTPVPQVPQKEKKSSTRKGVFGAIAASGDKANASKPKRADRRRTIARFTTAILRAEGSHVFISRDGLGYRKAFDKFLAQTYGKTFDVNGYWWTNARVEPFLRLLVHIASEGATNISEKDAKELFKKKDERQAAEWVLDEDKLAKCASGMTAKDLAAIFVGKPRKTKKGFVRGTPLLVPTDKETLSVDVEAVKKSEEEKKMATENRSKIRTEKKAAAASAAAAAGAQTKTTTSTGSKEKHTKAATTRKKVVASESAKPTDSNTGSVLTDGVLPGRSRTPNFFQQQLPSQKSLNAMMMLPPSPKPGANNPPAQQQGFRATSSMTPPPDVARLFQNVQGFSAVGSNNASSNSLLMLGSRPGSRQGAIAAAGVARQYSSDLSRMMSEFNTDPDSSNLFLSSYNALSASELDAVAATMATNPALKRGMSRRQPSASIMMSNNTNSNNNNNNNNNNTAKK